MMSYYHPCEAFRDLVHKDGRPTDLKAALRESARRLGDRSALFIGLATGP
jgi:hypothetical protein